ncbi:MAG: hypothetical protein ABI883_04545, partial [Chthoniobacterales bacterium]
MAFTDGPSQMWRSPRCNGIWRRRPPMGGRGLLAFLAALFLVGGSLGDRFGQRGVFFAGANLLTLFLYAALSPRSSSRNRHGRHRGSAHFLGKGFSRSNARRDRIRDQQRCLAHCGLIAVVVLGIVMVQSFNPALAAH